MAMKYSHWVAATPAMPYAAMSGSSRTGTRKVCGRVTPTIRSSPKNAPVERSSVSSCAGIPPMSITFETVPLRANSSAAVTTIR